MLVLSRKKDETVTMTVPPSETPTTITVTQVDIRGDKSRIGFDAPREVEITRPDYKSDASDITDCPRCEGTGKYARFPSDAGKPCAICDGTGKLGADGTAAKVIVASEARAK